METVPESHRYLLDAQFAALATVGRDGRPQLSEVWFLAEEAGVSISLSTARQKTKNLLRRPECSLLILDVANPFKYLELRGDAETEPDDDFAFAERVGAKYGADLRAYDAPEDKRIVVRIRPVRVNAVDMGG